MRPLDGAGHPASPANPFITHADDHTAVCSSASDHAEAFGGYLVGDHSGLKLESPERTDRPCGLFIILM